MRPTASVIAAAFSLWSASAFAGQIAATGYSVVGGGVNAHVSYAGSPNVSNEYVGSGEISLTVQDSPSGASSSLLVWCTDLFDNLAVPSVYDVSLLTRDHGTVGTLLSALQLGQINALISHGSALLASGFSNQVSSAIQLAIWSVEYGSAFSFTSDDGGVADLVSTYVGHVSGSAPAWSADPTQEVAQITMPGGDGLTPSQGLSYLTPAAIPEPASMALFGTGLVGLAFAWRRKRR
jgi:PEP-CTERM motif